jgi:hypothetical protein
VQKLCPTPGDSCLAPSVTPPDPFEVGFSMNRPPQGLPEVSGSTTPTPPGSRYGDQRPYAGELIQWLDAATLTRVWPALVLPPRLRRVWESRFPELASAQRSAA